MYSDSIIVDAIPRQTQPPDENENYVKKSSKVIQMETEEKQLTREQVVHMLKNRFKNDFDEWQNRKEEKVSHKRDTNSHNFKLVRAVPKGVGNFDWKFL